MRIYLPKKCRSAIVSNTHAGLYSIFFLFFLIASCSEKHPASINLSNEFQPVYDSTSRLFEANQITKGLNYLDSAVKDLPNLSTADKFRAYSFHFVVSHNVRRNNRQALLYADSMLTTIQGSTDPKLYAPLTAEANFAKGDALFELGRYTDAYTCYYQGYLIGHDSYDNCTLSDYTYRMGMITYKQGNYKYAASYFKQSFDLCGSCKNAFASFFRQQEVLDNIALSYRNYGKRDSALIYFDNALKYISDNELQYKSRSAILEVARAVILGNKADVLSAQGQYQKAIQLLEKSITTNLKKGNDSADAELSEVKLGQLYIKLHQDALLLPLLKNLRIQLDSVKNSDAEAGWDMLMATYYKYKNEPGKALPFVEAYHQIKDSLDNRNRNLKASNVNDHFDNINKHYQIQALRNQERVYFYTGVIFLSMSLIILLLIYRNYRKSHQEMKMVNALNKQVLVQKDELERTLYDLENSSKEKDRILRTVAHDLRNPLGGIASLTGAMVDDNDYTAEQLELLKMIKDTAHDTLELINEILEATNNTAAELHTQPVDINILLNNSVELMRFKAAEKNQKIMLYTLDAPEQLMISREKIWRVISNLISNAIKFSPVGSDIRVSITDNASDVQISVNDNGIGIPDTIKNKIFNMFTEAKRPGTLGEKSFGLGLSICRQIIEKHHGKIWFESNSELGTTFYVRLSKMPKLVRKLTRPVTMIENKA